jgi:MYXO-CTERM domain-containing protein
MGLTEWDFCWTAPGAGTGVITAYLSAVDGNGGDGTENFPNDTVGDDVAAGAVPISEVGTAAPPQTGGCDAGSGAGPGSMIVILAALALVLRKQRRRIAIVVLGASLATGCVHVRPRQRGTLAHRNMRFAPDPTEDELDLHMQEAREGSSGGYGSSGGGCGCN